MIRSNRCLYVNSFFDFCSKDNNSILGAIIDSYHGDLLTSAREAWVEEIKILKSLLEPYKLEEGKIILPYNNLDNMLFKSYLKLYFSLRDSQILFSPNS